MRAAPAVSFFGWMRIDDAVLEELSGLVNYRDLAAGADAGIDAEHAELAGGRGEQQVLQVLAKHLNGVGVRALLQLQTDLGLDRQVEQALVGVLDGQLQVRRPVSWCLEDLALEASDGAQRVELDLEVKHLLVFAAANGQHAMGRDFRHRLAVVVIHLELFLLVDGAFDLAAHDYALVEHHLPERLAEIRILADHFRDDVPRAFEILVRAWLRERTGRREVCSHRYSASGSSPFSRAMVALVRRFGL